MDVESFICKHVLTRKKWELDNDEEDVIDWINHFNRYSIESARVGSIVN